MRTVIMPPDAPTLMWSTRAIGYTTPAAVADLIDNSISAGATSIAIEFISGDDAYVSILDNGNGMDAQELQLAMKYGSGNPLEEREETDLGRFGLGLKTASLSQCRRLTVASKRNGVINAYCWDLDHVFNVREWQLLELDNQEIQSLPQIEQLNHLNEGTIVLWNKLDKMCAGDEDKDKGFLLRIKEVMDHLALTFHRYLQGEPGLKKISITSNGLAIEPRDPFYIARSDEMPSERIPVMYVNTKGEDCTDTVVVTPFILPFSDTLSQTELDLLGGKEGLIRNQGFYVYRNKRLIVAADWFRIARKTDLTKLCRVRVDMPNTLDELWTIDVKKSMALPPEVVRKNLRKIIEPILKQGKRKYRFRATKESKPAGTQLWMPGETRNGIVYNINLEHPVVKELMDSVPDKRRFKLLLRLLEQNIPVNAIHTDFYDDKKFAYEDIDVALQNIKENLRELLCEIKPEDRQEVFDDLMTMMPFSEYSLTLADLGDIANG